MREGQGEGVTCWRDPTPNTPATYLLNIRWALRKIATSSCQGKVKQDWWGGGMREATGGVGYTSSFLNLYNTSPPPAPPPPATYLLNIRWALRNIATSSCHGNVWSSFLNLYNTFSSRKLHSSHTAAKCGIWNLAYYKLIAMLMENCC